MVEDEWVDELLAALTEKVSKRMEAERAEKERQRAEGINELVDYIRERVRNGSPAAPALPSNVVGFWWSG